MSIQSNHIGNVYNHNTKCLNSFDIKTKISLQQEQTNWFRYETNILMLLYIIVREPERWRNPNSSNSCVGLNCYLTSSRTILKAILYTYFHIQGTKIALYPLLTSYVIYSKEYVIFRFWIAKQYSNKRAKNYEKCAPDAYWKCDRPTELKKYLLINL